MDIRSGSKWWASNGEQFVVLATHTIDGNDWVHYRAVQLKNEEVKEFSCYKESFLSRFTQLPE